MAGLAHIRKYIWKAYERSLGVNPLGRAEKLLVSWAASILVVRYIVNCFFALPWLCPAPTGYGRSIVLFNLLYILVFWIVLPFLLSGVSPSERRSSAERLLLTPLGPGRLFLSDIVGLLVRPVYAVLFGLTLIGMIPLFIAFPSLTAAAGGVLYAFLCLGLSACASLTGEAASRSRLVSGILRLAIPVFFAAFIFLNIQFRITADGLFLKAGTARVLWDGPRGGNGLARLFAAWSPAAWLASAAAVPGGWQRLGFLAVGAALCAPTAFLMHRLRVGRDVTFRRVFITPSRRRPGRPLPGGLFMKEASALLRSADFWMGLGVGLYFAFDILTRHETNERVFAVMAPFILFLNLAAVFNSFGMDKAAFGRYLLAPRDLKSVLTAKNTAFVLAAGAELLPMAAAGLMRFGFMAAANLALNCLLAFLVFCILGNFLSLALPAARARRGFTASRQSGGFLGLAFNIFFGLGMYALSFWTAGPLPCLLKTLGAGALFFVYRRLLPAWERRLMEGAEEMAARFKAD